MAPSTSDPGEVREAHRWCVPFGHFAVLSQSSAAAGVALSVVLVCASAIQVRKSFTRIRAPN